MSDIEVTIKLSAKLLKRMRALGLQLEDLPTLIEDEVNRRERKQLPIQSISKLTDRIAALPEEIKPTPDEIDDAIREMREEMAAERRAWQETVRRTAGSLADDPIERAPQGEYEKRDEIQ